MKVVLDGDEKRPPDVTPKPTVFEDLTKGSPVSKEDPPHRFCSFKRKVLELGRFERESFKEEG